MQNFHRVFLLGLVLFYSMVSHGQSDYGQREDVRAFAESFAKEHNKHPDNVLAILAKATKQQSILDAISRPAEKVLNWDEYRKIFIEENRITRGIAFWKEHKALIDEITSIYPVAPEMIIAIIGVETRYGRIMGNYLVLDALMTLGFDYEPRARFFRGQLEQFLLMVDEQKLDPAILKGSYAGAMGFGQFIPGSYRAYAVDYDKDGVADIWSNPADAIASVANYFIEHGWDQEDFISWQLSTDVVADTLVSSGLKPDRSIAELRKAGLPIPASLDNNARVTLMKLEGGAGLEYWLGFDNFYTITRYNHSHMYAMAAYQLSQMLKSGFTGPQ